MALRKLVSDLTDISGFFEAYPNQERYRTKAGPAYVRKQPFLARSLTYGKDRPGGGDSPYPLIVKYLPPVENPPGTNSPDFLLRDPSRALNWRVDDVTRITKFFTTTEGTLFLGKQQLLSLQNPIVPGRPNRSTPVSGLYNPALTLLQVAGAGTGLHVERQGLIPLFTNKDKYETVYTNLSQDPENNRLVVLRNLKIGALLTGAPNPTQNKPNIYYGSPELTGVSRDPNLILSYAGGPGGIFGSKTNTRIAGNRAYGETADLKLQKALSGSFNKTANIKSSLNLTRFLGVSKQILKLGYGVPEGTTLEELRGIDWNRDYNSITLQGGSNRDNTIYLTGNTFPDTNPALTNEKGVYTFRQRDFINQEPIGKIGGTTVFQDFRKRIYDNPDQIRVKDKLLFTDYTNLQINIESRIGTGHPGKRGRNRSVLTSYDNDTIDRITMMPLYKSDVVADGATLTRDLAKFRFEVIDNQTPSKSTYIHFRAFLGNIQDSYSSQIESQKYIGRGEKLYTYTGFDRQITFSFKVAAQSRAEMKPIYQKLNYLASTLAPDYSGGYMKGNIIRLTIGDLIYMVPGYLTTLTYTVPEEASWEIGLNEPEGGTDSGVLETPKLFDVNVSFLPIHNFVPTIGADYTTAYITRDSLTVPATQNNPYLNTGPNIQSTTGSISPSNMQPFGTVTGSRIN
jgi:hypothetical protein